MGAGHLLPWTELNPSMMAADVLQVGGQTCSLCQAHDHRREECALATSVSSNERHLAPMRALKRYVGVSTDRQGLDAALLISVGRVVVWTTGQLHVYQDKRATRLALHLVPARMDLKYMLGYCSATGACRTVITDSFHTFSHFDCLVVRIYLEKQ